METYIAKTNILVSLIVATTFTIITFANAEGDNDVILQRLSALEYNQRDLQSTIDIQKKEFDELKRACSSENRFSRSVNGVNGSVGFTVYLDHDINYPGLHKTIKFNQVITNEGSGYDIQTGVFSCPASGMYLLSVFVGERGNGGESWVSIRVNSAAVVEAVVDTYHDHQDLQGGNVVLKRLNKGDTVWVEAIGNNDHIEGAPTARITTFSGVYLYP